MPRPKKSPTSHLLPEERSVLALCAHCGGTGRAGIDVSPYLTIRGKAWLCNKGCEVEFRLAAMSERGAK